ncbi:MAG: toprim domain-containing protein [Candidatus Micrarchaeota archaeon]
MSLEEKAKALDKLVKGLNGKVLVVEGKHDVNALRQFGLNNRVFTATGKPERVITRVTETKAPVVLLFDFDEEGKRKTKFFQQRFLLEGTIADVETGKRLKALLGLRTIEELNSKYEELLRELKNKKVN